MLAAQAALFRRGALLPEIVFADGLAGFCWLEFDEILDSPFFDGLKALAARFGETEFYAVCDEPFPQENFGHSGVARFKTSDPVSAYAQFLDTEHVQPTISARHIGNRFWFYGPTLTWAIHADRSVELAVGGQRANAEWPAVTDLNYLSWDGVLEIASYPFRGRLPEHIAATYAANYRARTWLQ